LWGEVEVLLGLAFFERPRGVVITGLWALVDVPVVWARRQNWDVDLWW